MKIFLFLIVLVAASSPALSLAENEGLNFDLFRGQKGISPVLTILNRLINWLYTVLVVLAIIFLLIAAYNYLLSSGDPTKTAKAHKILIFAAVSLAVGILARGIVALIESLVLTK